MPQRGISLRVDPSIEEIASRTVVHLSDIALALAAGSAAVLALTRGISSALVGWASGSGCSCCSRR